MERASSSKTPGSLTAITKRLDSIQARSGISGREVAQLISTTPQTVSRWRQGHASPQPDSLDRLLKLDWLTDQLSAIYEPDEARLWLFRPHVDLGGERPADLIASGRADEVLDLIDRLQSGAYI
jgi:putative toxin-antitoxin system antitoxin component (TIGR02293 family)